MMNKDYFSISSSARKILDDYFENIKEMHVLYEKVRDLCGAEGSDVRLNILLCIFNYLNNLFMHSKNAKDAFSLFYSLRKLIFVLDADDKDIDRSAFKYLESSMKANNLFPLFREGRQYIWDKLLPSLIKAPSSYSLITKEMFENFIDGIDTRGAEWSFEGEGLNYKVQINMKNIAAAENASI